MAKIPAAQMRIQLEELAKKLASQYTDKEIMRHLKLKRRTFYRYKAKVARIYGNIAEKKTEEMLDAEAQLLKDRFLRLYRQLEQSIANDNNTRLKDKAVACTAAADLAITTYKLEVESLRHRQARRELKRAEAKAEKYVEA